jgi:predicted PurR-regulated permease PerM
MNKSAKISYVLIAIMLLLVGVLHLATPFITLMFSYFALTKLSFGRSKALALVLFMILASALGFVASSFVKQAYVALPDIGKNTIPGMIAFAEKNQVELPFSDYESLKILVRDSITDKFGNVGRYAKAAVVEVVAFFIGLVSAVSLFINARFQLEPEPHAVKDNIYTSVWGELALRFQTFYQSFATVMGAQIAISTINTILTSVFLLYYGFKHAAVLIGLTFLCGLLPIIGNLISNSMIVCVAFMMEPRMALFALIYLVVLHKLEYFLNSKIIGNRINNPMWMTLLGLIIGEKLMGIPGMILAPVVLHYIKVEASRSKMSDLGETVFQPPSAPETKAGPAA